MSNHLGVSKTLELLDHLGRAVREVAAREQALEGDFRKKSGLEQQRHETAVGELKNRLEAGIAEADAHCQAAQEAARAKCERRQSWMLQAQRTSKDQALKKIENHTGSRKYELQKEIMQTKRRRETDLAANESRFLEFKNHLAEEHQTLALLENAARTALSGFWKFRRMLAKAPELAHPDLAPDENQLLGELRELLGKTRSDLDRFRKFLLPHFFQYLPVWLFLVVGQIPLAPLLRQFGIHDYTYLDSLKCAGALLGVGTVLYQVGKRQAGPLAEVIAGGLAKARRLHDACAEKAETRFQQEIERIESEFTQRNQALDQAWDKALADAAEWTVSWPRTIDEREARLSAWNEALHQAKREHLEHTRADTVNRLRHEAEAREQELQAVYQARAAKLDADYQARWKVLEEDWRRETGPIYQTIGTTTADAEQLSAPWESPAWKQWSPPSNFGQAARFAQLEVDVAKLAGTLPLDRRLALPGPAQFTLPLLLTYPQQGSILFETSKSGHQQVADTLNNIILRLLSVTPPGRLSFTIIDPVGLGQNFSGVMHLADYAEHVINSRIWTQSGQIEERLAALNEHMEKVIQMYLRNEYATIAEYNEQAGNIAEKYHFLVVAGFPANFTDVAAKRLLSIAASGARCGVYTLIHWDRRQPLPADFVPDELRKSSVCLTGKGSDFVLAGHSLPGLNLVLDPSPSPELATEFIHQVGLRSRDSNRVEVPFAHVAPPESEVWSVDTASELRVPIGRTGATKLQYLAVGKGTRQHALIAGKTGSGKSTLFHVIITNLALWCSPEQVEFYLVDFKKGVEFKCYATRRLPHARVVAIESDREFGLSVLQRVDEELKRRGDLFRALGAQDIPGYKKAGGTEPVPRSLLIIDEFQEFFVEDDRIAQNASVLLDRIVRQGRAFGIHVLLGSQTLGGAYTLARATLGQMVIRIALQCNEADAFLIMDDNNPAPRLLSRPGEGIYNDNAGSLEGNSPFQAVWLPDDVRDAYLARVSERVARSPAAYSGPIVFEGNAPADVRENSLLRSLLAADSIKPATGARLWLGAPNSIKGPTEAMFRRQSGNHLLMVGQREDAMLAMLAIGLVSLAAQHSPGTARLVVLDASAPGSAQQEFLERIIRAIPGEATLAKSGDVTDLMNQLVADLKSRGEDEHAAKLPTTYLFIHGLQKFKKLRPEDDFSLSVDDTEGAASAGAQFNQLVTEGAGLGMHVIATCDTYNNVNRFLGRKALSEFEMRVLFQMSANDSASLIDNPKAGTLGLHRALFYNEQEGYLETFRPYALPAGEWLEQAAANLRRLWAKA